MNRLLKLRKEKKLSQESIAEIFGVNLRTWRRWEYGESQIRTNKIKQLADYFGVSEGYLLGYIDNCLDDNQKETGHTEETPRYVKNILARLRELQPHDREVWLKAIMGEFKQDFSHAKWRDGYEQGKLEGAMEYCRPLVSQFIADWYEEHKYNLESDIYYLIRCWEDEKRTSDFYKWFDNLKIEAIKILVNMHQFGYEVEKEIKYQVSMPNTRNYKNHAQLLCEADDKMFWCGECCTLRTKFTHKELEANGFGWVFDCPGVEVKEVE